MPTGAWRQLGTENTGALLAEGASFFRLSSSVELRAALLEDDGAEIAFGHGTVIPSVHLLLFLERRMRNSGRKLGD